MYENEAAIYIYNIPGDVLSTSFEGVNKVVDSSHAHNIRISFDKKTQLNTDSGSLVNYGFNGYYTFTPKAGAGIYKYKIGTSYLNITVWANLDILNTSPFVSLSVTTYFSAYSLPNTFGTLLTIVSTDPAALKPLLQQDGAYHIYVRNLSLSGRIIMRSQHYVGNGEVKDFGISLTSI